VTSWTAVERVADTARTFAMELAVSTARRDDELGALDRRTALFELATTSGGRPWVLDEARLTLDPRLDNAARALLRAAVLWAAFVNDD
jgi:hypothetical protein